MYRSELRVRRHVRKSVLETGADEQPKGVFIARAQPDAVVERTEIIVGFVAD